VGDLLPQLIRAAQAGDQQAFSVLHGRYARMVHAILLARLAPADAEEQVQEVFLAAWKKLAQLDDANTFGAWLCAIARHRAIDCLRRRRPTEPLLDTLPDPHSGRSSDAVEARRVVRAIQGLPEAYRETLLMRLCEGLSGPEIAQVTGLEPGSVRVNLHRGMKLLREALGVEVKVADTTDGHPLEEARIEADPKGRA
jgi:RNA polymerase sigma-70 factor (ECF subfamily)